MRDMSTVDTIMVHCSATRPDWMQSEGLAAQVTEITRWHVEDRGWRGCGYAWLLGRKGDEHIGRDLDGDGDPWEEIGAGAKAHNSKVIHLCLIGGHGASSNDKFADHFTPQMDAALRFKISELREMFPSIKYVKGHNEVANKGCPGFQVGPWYKQVPARGLGGSKTLGGTIVGGAATVGTGVTAVGALDGVAQYMVIGFVGLAVLAFMFIARERIKAWAKGVR